MSSVLLAGCTSTTSSESTSVISTPEVELIGNEVPVTKVAPGTVSQQNAHNKVASYLEFSAFSRSGLIEQLEFEGFSTPDSTWAVDNVTVNWNEQAAMKAASYLDYSVFSRSGLMDQLGYEGFTRAQANYAVSQVGLYIAVMLWPHSQLFQLDYGTIFEWVAKAQMRQEVNT